LLRGTHSWFIRFRKLLVRYEENDCSPVALNHFSALILALGKIRLDVNISYGQGLRR
jgi:hypothetical protein